MRNMSIGKPFFSTTCRGLPTGNVPRPINMEILQADDHLQILGIKMEALASKISKLPFTF
jgi:hypothetical protein